MSADGFSPTPELRWARRKVQVSFGGVLVDQPVLQQRWVQHHIPSGRSEAASEWRDVPTVYLEAGDGRQ